MDQDIAVQMRAAMRRLTAGVCVVSSVGHDQKPCAMTVSSVTSVSDCPPSLLVCVNQSARAGAAIIESNKFAVNVLASSHEEVSNVCASSDRVGERFSVGDWQQETSTGLWFLASAPAVIFCELAQNVTHGTHQIFVGNITATRLNDDSATVLGYLNGGYRHFPLNR